MTWNRDRSRQDEISNVHLRRTDIEEMRKRWNTSGMIENLLPILKIAKEKGDMNHVGKKGGRRRQLHEGNSEGILQLMIARDDLIGETHLQGDLEDYARIR